MNKTNINEFDYSLKPLELQNIVLIIFLILLTLTGVSGGESMDSGSDKNLENTVNRIYPDQLVPKINTSKKMSTLANQPNILEMSQEVKKSCGDKQVEITSERIKNGKEHQRKTKQ